MTNHGICHEAPWFAAGDPLGRETPADVVLADQRREEEQMADGCRKWLQCIGEMGSRG